MSATCEEELPPKRMKPNPNWAQLPLFDRSKWETVRFGDVVDLVSDTSRNPEAEGITRFIGLEHLEPGSLHIKTWGELVDGVTFTKRCRKGQVLFGKRRAYQRKVALAEFEALVSGDIYVFQAKEELLDPKLLPFICMSERFFQFAVETSAGSLSPRTNWSHLAEFEFSLPPLDQQRRIAELLWVVDAREQSVLVLQGNLERARAALVESVVSRAEQSSYVMKLLDGCVRVTDGTHQPPKFTENGVPFFYVKTISSGYVDWNQISYVSQETYNELTRRVRPKRGDVLYTAVGSYGIAVLVDFDQPFVFQRHIAHIIPDPKLLDAAYLTTFLNSPQGKRQSDACAIGSAQPTVTLKSLCGFKVVVPSIHEQRKLVEQVTTFDTAYTGAGKECESLRSVRASMLNVLTQ